MKVNKKFIRSEKLGEILAMNLNDGYDITVEIFDGFDNGRIIFEHDNYSTRYVEFIGFTPQDEIECKILGINIVKEGI